MTVTGPNPPQPHLDVPALLPDFCRRWRIRTLSLFGSVVREDFGPASDVDVLVTFQPDASWSYWDWPVMRDELSKLFGGRAVDLVEEAALKNPFRRSRILAERRVVYAA